MEEKQTTKQEIDRENAKEQEFTFIKETVVKKRNNKLKKALLLTLFALFLAVLFGTVSRAFFTLSEPLVNIVLGVSPTPLPTQPPRNQIQVYSQQDPSYENQPKQQELTPWENQEDKQNQTNADLTTEHSEAKDSTKESSPGENPKEKTEDASDIENDQEQKTTDEKTKDDENKAKQEKTSAGIQDYLSIYQDIRRVATNASSAIATITVTNKRTDWFEQVYEEKYIRSGMIVGDNNVELLILTEASGLLNADELTVTVGGFTTQDAFLYASDEDYNLAVLGISYASIPPEHLEQINYALFGESYSLFVGTPILAIGNPNGYPLSFELGTVTERNSLAYVTDNSLGLFHTNIPNYENGSGFIINLSGEVIGLITHKFMAGQNESLSTAIGISRLKPMIEKLVNGEKPILFGVVAEELSESLRKEMNSKIGILVTKVIRDSAAEKAGIREGDVLQMIVNKPMYHVSDLFDLVEECEPDETLRVLLQRKGTRSYSEVECMVTVEEK